jgi:hypothetical protein
VIHNADGSTTVTDMTVVDISQASRVDGLLSEAMEKRSVGCTQLNEQSSRSHMVFIMRIDGANEVGGQHSALVVVSCARALFPGVTRAHPARPSSSHRRARESACRGCST